MSMSGFQLAPRRSKCLIAALAVLVAGSTLAQAESVRRALLIGCTEFPRLRELYGAEGYSGVRLTGPANDVALLRSALTDSCGFKPENIVALSGWDESAQQTRPTRQNILAALERLAADAQRGDVVVLFLASHCTQLLIPLEDAKPDETRAAAPPSVRTAERDKYDEVFMPADAGAMDWQKGTLENGIFDHEFATCIQRLRDGGAFVFAIVNTPHAAGLLDAAPEMLLKRPTRDDTPKGHGRLDGLAALYACHADESNAEMALEFGPPDGRKPHGLLTVALCEALRNDQLRGESYRRLFAVVLESCEQRAAADGPQAASEGDVERKVFDDSAGR